MRAPSRWWFITLAASRVFAAADYGVCWTRNGVASLNATALEGKLAGVWLSATLLRRGDPALRTCLVTDAPAALARRALDATSARAGEAPGLIGLVVAARAWSVGSGRGGRHDDARWAAARSALGRPAPSDALARFESRAARLLSFLAPPFATTLFVDDDTAFCGAGVGAFLGALHASEDLRRVDVFLTKEKETHGDARGPERALSASPRCAPACARTTAAAMAPRDAAACVVCRMAAAMTPGRGACPGLDVDARWAQAGAMVARRTNGTRAFVGDWLDGFLKYHLYHPGWHGDAIDPSTKHPDRVAGREFGRDQPPLDKLLAAACAAGAARRAWTLGKLPAALNVRKANAQPVLVWGKHVTLHTKQLTTNARPVESRGLALAADACRVATADAAWRLLAMPESTASRNLAQLPCTATADGLLGAAPYGTAEKGARLVWNMAAEVADLLRERRSGRCVWDG